MFFGGIVIYWSPVLHSRPIGSTADRWASFLFPDIGNHMSSFVRDYYNSHAENEWNRLELPLCKIEFASTMRLIEKYFPRKGRICDIGGGPGRYTIELIRRGYEVSLIDLSEEEIQLAHDQLKKLGILANQLIVGDARDLNILESTSFDAALLLGPMYHIVEPVEREGVLQELMRILKPNGIAIIAYLNSWGIMRTGIVDLAQWYEDATKLRSMVNEHIFMGQSLSGFTECYWSTPEAAIDEIQKAGLEIISYAGAEAPVNLNSTEIVLIIYILLYEMESFRNY